MIVGVRFLCCQEDGEADGEKKERQENSERANLSTAVAA
jgi:hypothetical protein